MKTFLVLVAALLLAGSSSADQELMREKRLRTVTKVHGNPLVVVTGEEKRAKRHGHCVDNGERKEAPVCGSNGKKYLNIDVFNYNKCLIQAELVEVIEVVKMDLCEDAEIEDADAPDWHDEEIRDDDMRKFD